ncbi:MAG: radical SAM protein [Flavobacteriales bacterium]|nr:radical SAM protein [Flavobacteriales bacterium]
MSPGFDPIAETLVTEYNKTRPLDRRDKICHAPFKSLLFIPSGKAMACHYNRGHSLGQYPESSIHDIWFGEEISKLRHYLDNKDLSYGCQNCKQNIVNKQFHTAGAWRHDYLGEAYSGYPVLIDLQIDNTCNLECAMCSGEYSSLIRKNREKKPAYINPYDDAFIEQLDEFIPHLKGLNLTGGEPFLIETYYRILDRVKELNPEMQIYIHTNGTVLNNKVKSYLEDLNFNFTISVDSIVKETYEKIRVNAKLENVLANIKFFHEYTQKKESSLHVKCCVMQDNILEIPDFMHHFNEQNISVQLKPVWFPSTRSLRNRSSSVLATIVKAIGEPSLRGDTHFQRLNIERYKELISQVQLWSEEAKAQPRENTDLDELTIRFFNGLEASIMSDNTLAEWEKSAKITRCKAIGEVMIASIDNIGARTAALRNFVNLPAEFVLAEIDRGSIDMLNARFEQEAVID